MPSYTILKYCIEAQIAAELRDPRVPNYGKSSCQAGNSAEVMFCSTDAVSYISILSKAIIYSSRCTPSRCRQRRSTFSCSAPASHPAACSAHGQAAEPFRLRGRSPLPVRPFSAVLRKCGARGPITSPPLDGAAPGSARHLPGRTQPRRRTFSADSRQLARATRSFSTLIPQGS